MEAVWKLLAAVLLAGYPDLPAPPTLPEPLKAALIEVATEWEILDENSARRTFCSPAVTAQDIEWLRRSRQYLADAPALADAERLPTKAAIYELLAANTQYKEHLDSRRICRIWRWEEFAWATNEAERLRVPWEMAVDARNSGYCVNVRRTALKKLREEIGPAAYYAGDWPPWVPTWRFQEIK